MNNGKDRPPSAPRTVTPVRPDPVPAASRRLTWLADVVPISGSLLLWAMGITLLPPDIAAATVIVAVAAARWLCRPGREPLAVRLLAQGRPLSRGEEALLGPALAQLANVGLAPQRLFVAPDQGRQVLAEPVGRCSMVLAQRVLAAAARGSADAETVAVVLAHAEARRAARFGMRHDVARRVALVPGHAIASLVQGLARRLRWVPGAGAFPAIAAVVIATAALQTFSQGQWWIGLIIVMTTSAVAISHTARARCDQHINLAADRMVADRGLRVPLRTLLLSEGSRRSLDRVEGLSSYQGAPVVPIRRLRVVSDSPA